VQRTLLAIRAFNEANDMVVWTALNAKKPTAIWGKAPVMKSILNDVG
jgi:hypothetical protein